MRPEIMTVTAVVGTGVPSLWRVGGQGWASAIRKGGSHPFRRRSYRKRQGAEAAVATQSAPPSCTVYTAGWCEPDPGPGGWAYVQVSDGTAREERGEYPETTTIRMELTAAIKALEATASGSTVLAYTGSHHVQQGMTGWVRNGWHTGTSQPVENQDLWEQLRHLDAERHVRWEWLDVPMAAVMDGGPQHHHVHALMDAERSRAAVHAAGAQAEGQGDERGTAMYMEGIERQGEARPQHRTPSLAVRPGPELSTDERRQALMAECRALEQKWAMVHEEALHLDHEWQRLLSMFISRVEAQRSGQPPSWTDGALMFYDLNKHAARTSSLAHEAFQTCRQYTLALQGALDAMVEG
jgi:ribonuclease HI